MSILNSGDDALIVSGVTVEQAQLTFFVSTGGFSLAPGKETELEIDFAPREIRTYVGQLFIRSNAGNSALKIVELEGSGVSTTSDSPDATIPDGPADATPIDAAIPSDALPIDAAPPNDAGADALSLDGPADTAMVDAGTLDGAGDAGATDTSPLDGGASAACGNRILEGPEGCDDGNLVNGDGCSSTCTLEPALPCVGQPRGNVLPCEPDFDLGSALPLTQSGCTVGAGDDFPACNSSNAPDVAYQWTAPANGTYVFDTDGSGYDTVLSVRTPGCNGAELICDDDGGPSLTSRVTVSLSAGQSIVIVVDGFAMSAGAFAVHVAQLTQTGTDASMDGG